MVRKKFLSRFGLIGANQNGTKLIARRLLILLIIFEVGFKDLQINKILILKKKLLVFFSLNLLYLLVLNI
jgi:hypothetical protein